MKKLLFSAIILASIGSTAQVGINTTTPKATFDVMGKASEAKALDGIIAPRLTGDQLKAKTYTAAQEGAVVYVTAAATGTLAGQTIEVNATGNYVFNGTKWTKFSTKADNAWLRNNAVGAKRTELGSLADGTTARPTGTEFVSLDNGNVGIGTTTPANKLEVTATANPLKLNGLQTGAASDKILTVDANGVVRQVTQNTAVGAVKSITNLVGTTTQVVPQGTTVDVAGLTQTITVPAGKSSILQITATGYASQSSTSGNVSSQGAFSILISGEKLTTGYVSSQDANAGGLLRLPSQGTIIASTTLAPGTYTIKLIFKAWQSEQQINLNAVTAPYGGAVSGDEDALKSRLSIIEYNN